MIAKNKKIKVIFDTNVWISFLIGKRLSIIEKYIANRQMTIIVADHLIEEIKEVTSRERLQKYFPPGKVVELIRFLETIALKFEITRQKFVSRDPKDDFLLDLMAISKADYLVTGDKDLLILNPFGTTTVLTPGDFEKMLS
ncbi:twitching motility protein PilT [Bacteroidia bacterium]|nr:twitching motility protein PilT [Bacteroidia bacterium]